MPKTDTLGIIGVGNMGAVFAGGLAEEGEEVLLSEVDGAKLERFVREHPHCIPLTTVALLQRASCVVFAIKPGIYPPLLSENARHIGEETLLISLAAGLTLKQLQSFSQGRGHWVRLMPNVAASIGEGMLSLCTSEQVPKGRLEGFVRRLGALGRVDMLPEELMNVATAVSGSGPAYGFVFIEALADAAVRLGMDRARAYIHAAQTLQGAARLCLETALPPAQLKDSVTTPGGTTAEGLYALEAAGFRKAVLDAVFAAGSKASQLSQKNS
ncbi:MAG: pyrroline-5-carboxylate reductase [Proteobacteria bacterium]|nr:pyrroline-5-carboxylate reductase [Cystobacterineae bacterium]MCL2259101.1 pyrroline-5-carboxylate reductase [Cystobacterineae bacterium]MCL2314507.1 pyrroline-5-carboxylate reductase [Pseudomonadota bacterium]